MIVLLQIVEKKGHRILSEGLLKTPLCVLLSEHEMFKGGCWLEATDHGLYTDRQWDCIYVDIHTHIYMYKWIGVEFCLLNTVFEIGCHWFSKSYHKLKRIEMRTHFFPSGKKKYLQTWLFCMKNPWREKYTCSHCGYEA